MPVPPRMLNPISVEEAWNVIRLATDNVARLLQAGRGEEVVDQISLCSPALRLIARTPVPGADQAARDALAARASRAINLIARDSMAGNAPGVTAVFAGLQDALQGLAQGYEQAVVRGEVYHCPDHPDVISTDPAKICPRCPRRLQPRRIPYSFLFVEPARPTLKLSAVVDAAPAKGQEAKIILQVQTADGRPVPADDLIATHTQPVHVVIIDAGLEDHHLTHASPGEKPGEYSLSFTPALDAPYRLWAFTVPCATGIEEVLQADLTSPAAQSAPPAAEAAQLTSTAGGLRFQITLPTGTRTTPKAQAGRLQSLRLQVTGTDGKPFSGLEPFLNSFAHVTAVYADQKMVFQMHPLGGDVLNPELRGGPALSFKLFAPRPGMVRLFCTVRIGGKDITAPFWLPVVSAPG